MTNANGLERQTSTPSVQETVLQTAEAINALKWLTTAEQYFEHRIAEFRVVGNFAAVVEQ